ncbi:MAG: UDP-N-acetylmuramate--L-alanine ligase [Clostridia bacterium]|nr:UDP-N-acetylmuramate--L-alanine ligase [Clostridia bacterium]
MDYKINDLSKYKHIHLIGIGGVSMSAIAKTLHQWGYKITGSDASPNEFTDKLIESGIHVTFGHDLTNSRNADLVVYSAAISNSDPEIVMAKQTGIPLVTRGEFVGYLTRKYKDSICISGTHGKTTTTSMISLCFLEAKMDPTIQVGAILKQIEGNYTVGNSDYFILEACEYKDNFLKFSPKAEVILNIDNDHLDYFKTFENIKNSFIKYSELIPEDGVLVTNADDPNCLELEEYTKGLFITYGINNQNADYVAKNIRFNYLGFPEFDVFCNNQFYVHIKLSVYGVHNVSNALACIALCSYYGINKNDIINGLSKFTGAHRRLEYVGAYHGFSVYDDYGHHPTEIEATASAISHRKFNESWVIFQPHTYSRTKNLLTEFAQALLPFDHIIVTDIYAAREQNTFNITSVDLVNKIKELGKEALYMKDFDQIADYIRSHAVQNDFVLTLGAGTIINVGPKIIERDK